MSPWLNQLLYFESVLAASSLSAPERAPKAIFSKPMEVQNMGLGGFGHSPQSGAGNLVDSKPTSAELQTELKSIGKPDPARASDLPPSHSTERPEPGQGPGLGPWTTGLSPIPLACSPLGHDPIQPCCMCEVWKNSQQSLSVDGVSSWVQPMAAQGWADKGDRRCVSSGKFTWSPSIRQEAPERSPEQRTHIKCCAHVFRGEEILGISLAGPGAEKGTFRPSVF